MSIDKAISYEDKRKMPPEKQMAASSREELLYLLSPIYKPSELKDLDDDALKDLIDEMADRMARKSFGSGGSADDKKPKPIDPFEASDLANKLAAMSDAERESIEYMLEKLGVKKK